jgi:hypothetical protein
MGTQSIISILAWDAKRSTQSESDMVFSLLSLFHILSIFLLRISFFDEKRRNALSQTTLSLLQIEIEKVG